MAERFELNEDLWGDQLVYNDAIDAWVTRERLAEYLRDHNAWQYDLELALPSEYGDEDAGSGYYPWLADSGISSGPTDALTGYLPSTTTGIVKSEDYPMKWSIWSMEENGVTTTLLISKDSYNSKHVSASLVLNVCSELGHTWNQEEGVQNKLQPIVKRMEIMKNSEPSFREALLEDDAQGLQGVGKHMCHDQRELPLRIHKSKEVFPWKKSLHRIHKT